MAKRRTKKTSKKQAKEKTETKKNTRRKQNPNSTSQKKLKYVKDYNRNKKSHSVLSKRKESNSTSSIDYFESNKRKVLLPNELLEEAKNILKNKISLYSLRKAIKIYDISDEINYAYLNGLKNITKNHYKYIYTLSLKNKNSIIKKHKIKWKIFAKSSKLLFKELVIFLINRFKPDEDAAQQELDNYDLKYFEKFVIPINEGSDELKYYYFISIVLKWMKKDNQNKSYQNVPDYLSYFEDFFKNETNLNKIDHVFYAIFRIDLLVLNPKSGDKSSLAKVNLMINEDIKHKIEGLKLIEDKIEEDINKIKIKDDTVLTLNESGYIFKPIDYYFSSELKDIKPNLIIKSIVKKECMTYDYYIKNRLNCFQDEIKVRALFNYFKLIFPSRVIKEYYKKVKSFENFQFPLTNNKIIDYLLGKIICIAFNKNYWGLTNREGF